MDKGYSCSLASHQLSLWIRDFKCLEKLTVITLNNTNIINKCFHFPAHGQYQSKELIKYKTFRLGSDQNMLYKVLSCVDDLRGFSNRLRFKGEYFPMKWFCPAWELYNVSNIIWCSLRPFKWQSYIKINRPLHGNGASDNNEDISTATYCNRCSVHVLPG